MNKKMIPIMLMLFAGAMTSIVVYYRKLGPVWMLISTMAVMVVFYLIGSIVKLVLDSLEETSQEKATGDGAVIEKGTSEPESNVESAEGLDKE